MFWNVLERFGTFWNNSKILEQLGMFHNVSECYGRFQKVQEGFKRFRTIWNVRVWIKENLFRFFQACVYNFDQKGSYSTVICSVL